jgi:hypothetical protein
MNIFVSLAGDGEKSPDLKGGMDVTRKAFNNKIYHHTGVSGLVAA